MSNETQQWESLRASINDLYNTFAHYKLAAPILCEMTDAVVMPDGVTLRARVAPDFERYQWKAITTLGTIDDYKHFLPRLLELSCLQRRSRAMEESDISEPTINLDGIAMKLQYANANHWPPAERDALAGFGVARWRWELWLATDYGGDLRDSLTLLAVIGRPLNEILDASLRREELDEIRALAKFINRHIEFSIKSGGTRLGWTDSMTNAPAEFEQWLMQPHVEAALESAFYEIGEGEIAGELSNAVQKIGWLREMRSESK